MILDRWQRITASVVSGFLLGSFVGGLYMHSVWYNRYTTNVNTYAKDGTISESEVCRLLTNDEYAFYLEGCCHYGSDQAYPHDDWVYKKVCVWINTPFSSFDFNNGCISGCIEGLTDAWDTFNSTKDVMILMGDRCFEYCDEMVKTAEKSIEMHGGIS
jgi:hypothetical protein